MRLIRQDRGHGRSEYRTYETADGRFRVRWSKKQGARSCYSVLDQRTGFYVRAFTLADAREAITEIRRRNP